MPAHPPLAAVLLATITGLCGTTPAQRMPEADVVDTPAIGAGLCVSNVFQSNMVVQRDRPITVWGWATPGEAVAVSFAGDRQVAQAAADRSWRVALAAQPANSAPQAMVVQGTATQLVLDNVLVGDVWVLGGQSNMEFELEKVENGALEIVAANLPRIRVLTVPYAIGPEPHRSFPRLHEWSDWFGRHFRKGDWDECTPAIAKELSAIGYTFARRVHLASQVPIGVIDASRGGTTAQAWTPLARLRQLEQPFLRQQLADWEQRCAAWDPQQDLAQRQAQHHRWVERQLAAGKQLAAEQQREPSDLRPGPSADANHPGHCYEGMIAPLAGLGVKGVLFHQGYNNAFDGMPGVGLYRAVLPELIAAWRAAFGDPKLPFGILSLCTEGEPQTRDNYCEKMLDTGIYIREAHYLTFLALRRGGDTNLGFASTFDLRRSWYHPQVKIPAGERIARWALATQYGFDRELDWQPPLLLGMEARDDALVLRLDMEVGDPEDGAITGFAIAGEDRCFQPADVSYVERGKDDQGRPRWDRTQLVLRSPLVPAPQHFRYAFGRNPLANLQATGNKDLPFAAQRSDDFGIGEVPLGVLGDGVDGKGALTPAQQNRVRAALRQQDMRRKVAEAEAVLREYGPAGGAEPARRK
jgi:sialate O-acetylesterase